jgi:hypothetical protein
LIALTIHALTIHANYGLTVLKKKIGEGLKSSEPLTFGTGLTALDSNKMAFFLAKTL